MNIIIHLGGTWRRAEAAAKLANSLDEDYIIVVSSEGHEEKFRTIYREAGIPDEKVIHDTAAWDTVTNFTHTYKLLRKLGITKLYVVTSDFHMERSMAIANGVWGGRVPIESIVWGSPNPDRKEPWTPADRFRARLWRWTGILMYHTNVIEKRKAQNKLGQGHAWLEIGD